MTIAKDMVDYLKERARKANETFEEAHENSRINEWLKNKEYGKLFTYLGEKAKKEGKDGTQAFNDLLSKITSQPLDQTLGEAGEQLKETAGNIKKGITNFLNDPEAWFKEQQASAQRNAPDILKWAIAIISGLIALFGVRFTAEATDEKGEGNVGILGNIISIVAGLAVGWVAKEIAEAQLANERFASNDKTPNDKPVAQNKNKVNGVSFSDINLPPKAIPAVLAQGDEFVIPAIPNERNAQRNATAMLSA